MLARLRSCSHWRLTVIALLAVLIAGPLLVFAERRGSHSVDFDMHRTFGQRFLLKTPPLYDDYLCFNYMPVSAMYYSPMALLPKEAAFAARFLVALICLGFIFTWLWRLLPATVRPQSRLLLIALTVIFSFRYILRDLDDGGQHLIMLAMLVGGLVCARRGWNLLAGVWFGLAIALKLTPALLLPYLAWKRQWRLLGATITAAALWVVAPSLWLGTGLWWHYQQQWNQVALASFTGKDLGPLSEFMNSNDLRVQNQSLKLALTHLLVAYPEGDLRRPEKGYWTFLDLDPALARWLVNLGLAGLLLVFWRRTRFAAGADPAVMPLEVSGLVLLMLLFSPVTWLQHMVWVIPALFFILAVELSADRTWLGRALLGLYFVFTMGLNREILGGELNSTLLGSHAHTAGMLLLLGMVLWRIVTRKKACSEISAPYGNQPDHHETIRRNIVVSPGAREPGGVARPSERELQPQGALGHSQRRAG